jgi:hypothetical protein
MSDMVQVPREHLVEMSQTLVSCLDEIERLSEHSRWLNELSWRVAVLLGKVSPTDAEYTASPDDLMTELEGQYASLLAAAWAADTWADVDGVELAVVLDNI